MSSGFAAVFAHMWDTNGHMGGGWWIVMMIAMLLFWCAVIVGVVWLVRGGNLGGTRPESRDTALDILDRRFAEGAMSTEEYNERRAVMTSGIAHAGGRT